jgi:hypothetical protein
MAYSAGIRISRSVLQQPDPQPGPFDVYLRWFIGYGLAGLLYSGFAWSLLLTGSGKSRVELALVLPLKALIRLLEWVRVPVTIAPLIVLIPPVTGLFAGLLSLAVCLAWRGLGLGWSRAKYVLLGTAGFELALLGYGCSIARIHDGRLALPGRGDSLLGLALQILFVGGIALVALSPNWNRRTTSAS